MKSKQKKNNVVNDYSSLQVPLYLLTGTIALIGVLTFTSILMTGVVIRDKLNDVNEKLSEISVEGGNNVLGAAEAQDNVDPAEPVEPTDVFTKVALDDDPYMGDLDSAKIAIVEFSDYECPFCKRYFEETYPLIKENYVDTGKVVYVFRDYPLSFHNPNATDQAMAGECVQEIAGNEKYFDFHHEVFTQTTSNMGLEKAKLYDIAKKIGVDSKDFKTCLDSEKYSGEVQDDLNAGSTAGIDGTPGFIVGVINEENNEVDGKLVVGAQPYEVFEEAIEEQLSKL
jgi:protein-disulfide isomerase